MGIAEFRKLALSLPEAVESAHMGHPDVRVRGKIFATLGHPEQGWGMVKLTVEEQELLTSLAPDTFIPVKGGWGRAGATSVKLGVARKELLHRALVAAWRNTAPKTLVRSYDGGSEGDRKATKRRRRA
jgi:hypothetical protein